MTPRQAGGLVLDSFVLDSFVLALLIAFVLLVASCAWSALQ